MREQTDIELLSEPAELSVFLKGVVSPYAWIKCDMIEVGEEIGLFVQDNRRKQSNAGFMQRAVTTGLAWHGKRRLKATPATGNRLKPVGRADARRA